MPFIGNSHASQILKRTRQRQFAKEIMQKSFIDSGGGGGQSCNWMQLAESLFPVFSQKYGGVIKAMPYQLSHRPEIYLDVEFAAKYRGGQTVKTTAVYLNSQTQSGKPFPVQAQDQQLCNPANWHGDIYFGD